STTVAATSCCHLLSSSLPLSFSREQPGTKSDDPNDGGGNDEDGDDDQDDYD
ncbi:hypothetical protein Tco_1024534, partial [Tanacetum coccineum]